MTYPAMVRIRQQFDRPRVEDVTTTVRASLEHLNLHQKIRPGQSVALTAGSRGIANIVVILKAVVRHLRDLGAQPFMVPAMGSHGGGTAEGQRHLLEGYGISEAAVGAPLKASMEVVSLGSTPEGFPVLLDRQAAEADHIGIVARVKPHTRFAGPLESGLLKMMMIGLGKHEGAIAFHRLLQEAHWDTVLRSVTRTLRARAPIAFGVALVENAYDETARIEAIRPDAFEEREAELLILARGWLPRLPCRQVDLLIVDEIGKDISGSGLDTNVIGRKEIHSAIPDADHSCIRHIFVRGLTARTQGNATGIGLADFTTTRLVRGMNYRSTVINCLTAGSPEGARLPVHFETDREVIEACLAIGPRSPEKARVLRIRNTLCLEEVHVSEACCAEEPGLRNRSLTGAFEILRFDDQGNLPPF